MRTTAREPTSYGDTQNIPFPLNRFAMQKKMTISPLAQRMAMSRLTKGLGLPGSSFNIRSLKRNPHYSLQEIIR